MCVCVCVCVCVRACSCVEANLTTRIAQRTRVKSLGERHTSSVAERQVHTTRPPFLKVPSAWHKMCVAVQCMIECELHGACNQQIVSFTVNCTQQGATHKSEAINPATSTNINWQILCLGNTLLYCCMACISISLMWRVVCVVHFLHHLSNEKKCSMNTYSLDQMNRSKARVLTQTGTDRLARRLRHEK